MKQLTIFLLLISSCTSRIKPTKEHLTRLDFIKKSEQFLFLDNMTAAKRASLKPLLQLYYKDQLYRDNKNFDYYIANRKKQDILDAQNQKVVGTYLDSVGFPTIQNQGFISTHGVGLVLEHAPLNFKEKYAPLMFDALQKGSLTASQYAIFFDKMLCKKKELQKYGTQVLYKNGEYSLYPVDLRTVEQHRNEIKMLEGLDYYLERNFKIKLDSTDYMQSLPVLMLANKIDTSVSQ